MSSGGISLIKTTVTTYTKAFADKSYDLARRVALTVQPVLNGVLVSGRNFALGIISWVKRGSDPTNNSVSSPGNSFGLTRAVVMLYAKSFVDQSCYLVEQVALAARPALSEMFVSGRAFVWGIILWVKRGSEDTDDKCGGPISSTPFETNNLPSLEEPESGGQAPGYLSEEHSKPCHEDLIRRWNANLNGVQLKALNEEKLKEMLSGLEDFKNLIHEADRTLQEEPLPEHPNITSYT